MRFALLAGLAGLCACLTPTQITVKLRGIALSCPGGDPAVLQETGLLAKPQINDPSDVSAITITGTICRPSTDSNAVTGELDLGDAVLVPQDGPGPVEVLAIGALDGAKADDCRSEYARLFNEAAPCKADEPCRKCIFARRSLAFVEHSSLEVRVELEPSCAGVVCDASQTCSKGACISAETQCSDANGCELTNAGGGNAGAGGSGAGGASSGGGGASAAGGSGGGGGMQTGWETLHTGAVYDVVGNDVDHAEPFRLYAATGTQVVVFNPAPVATPTLPAPNSGVYRALAHRKTVDGAVAMGSLGSTTSPSFNAFLNPPAPAAGVIRVGVAPYGSNDAAWVQQTSLSTSFFVPTQGEAPSVGTGLFMAPFGELPRLFVAQDEAGVPKLRAYDTANNTTDAVTLNADPSADAWSVWATQKTSGTDQLVVVTRNASEIFAATCTVSNSTCGFGTALPVDAYTTDLSGSILDLFGVAGTGGVDLYVLVKDMGLGTIALAKTAVPYSTGGLFVPIWSVVPLDPALGTPNALWVGKLDTGSPLHVFVATSTGLYKALAPVDQFFP